MDFIVDIGRAGWRLAPGNLETTMSEDARNITGSDSENGTDIVKKSWQAPSFYSIDADSTESGINNGPEILILLS